MRRPLAIKIHAILERHFPERRIFLKSDNDTRFIRLKPESQIIAFLGASSVIAWAIIATAILLMDSIGSGNFREQAKRDQRTYEERLRALSGERDKRAIEAQMAHERFDFALAQISEMQGELLKSETRRREMETGIEVIQSTLRRTMKERDAARVELTAIAVANQGDGGVAQTPGAGGTGAETFLISALEETARERDTMAEEARAARDELDNMILEIALIRDRNDAIFSQLEEAMTISVLPLDKMFRAAGLDTDQLIDTVKQGYSGQGGPLMPLAYVDENDELTPEALRANRILDQMDRINIYRIAAEKLPFALPVKSAFRYTSGFGMRWGRPHKGTDFAAAHGTPIYATADGVVTHAEWLSGYGKLIKIKHAFGIETRYAHLSRIRVVEGQKVSRGDRIGDMGNTGRSTGTHLHYEVRVGGKAVNPMTYIKAARNVF